MRISVKKLDATLECAGKNDIRSYLNGVHINHQLNRLESTDGHCALIINDAVQYEDDEDKLNQNIILHRDDIELAVQAAKKNKVKYLKLERDSNDLVRLGNIIVVPMDFKYPDIQRIESELNQSDETPSAIAFDFYLLKKWERVQKKRKMKFTVWRPDKFNIDKQSQTIADMQFIVMAMRIDEITELPE